MVTRHVLLKKMKTDFNKLIPELKDWNNGNGIDVQSWIGVRRQLPEGHRLQYDVLAPVCRNRRLRRPSRRASRRISADGSSSATEIQAVQSPSADILPQVRGSDDATFYFGKLGAMSSMAF